jgi:hypothetical protein
MSVEMNNVIWPPGLMSGMQYLRHPLKGSGAQDVQVQPYYVLGSTAD